ncbi:MAG: class F sortase [Dermatophilaceae bacterium]|nr:class F sortase [Dermatophilaceae bacterium]
MGGRRFVMVLAVLLVAGGLWCFVPHPGTRPSAARAAVTTWPDPTLSAPEGAVDQPGTSTAPAGPAPTAASSAASTAAPRARCRVGQPRRLAIPALGVDAAFEQIGLDGHGKRDASGRLPLGNPSDRTRAGWYAQGPRPGSGRGTVLTNGHTYLDGSAIFQRDFARRVAVGQIIRIGQDNGSQCAYRITRVWREIDSARDYPALVSSQHLYDFSGPERLLLATCGGSWDSAADNFDDISVVLAVPADAR